MSVYFYEMLDDFCEMLVDFCEMLPDISEMLPDISEMLVDFREMLANFYEIKSISTQHWPFAKRCVSFLKSSSSRTPVDALPGAAMGYNFWRKAFSYEEMSYPC